ncbi:cytochrome P450 [Hypoxylon sp. NC1633]|nr:cytochrome P450 [Hypoxylon sp. NC1633]
MALEDIIQVSLPYYEAAVAVLTMRNALLLLCGWTVYRLLLAAWYISPFHPLSHIPGPILARATYLPEFWYDTFKFGRYTHEIKRMHEIYGPIIRISPHEVHCNDVQFMDEIYAVSGRKRNKPPHQVSGHFTAEAAFSTIGHDQHRLRRAPLAKFFSRAQIAQLEPQIQVSVQSLCDKLLAQAGKAEPIDVQTAYSCFTSDVIAEYCFGESFGFLAQESWEPNFRRPTYAMLRTIYVFRFFPILRHTMALGSLFIKYLPEDTALMLRTLNTDVPTQIKRTKATLAAGRTPRPTIFGTLLSSSLSARDKSAARLAGEAASLLAAGTETASWTLAVATYHLLSQPATLARLAAELHDCDPARLPPWQALERLPYLGAVVREALRLSYGVSSRSARVAAEEEMVYRGSWTPGRGSRGGAEHGEKKKKLGESVEVEHVIPRGYAVGMSAALVHHDEAVYPNSHAFVPERWLDADNNDDDDDVARRSERCLMSFGKGSRACLGMNLAYCELYLALAALTLRVFPHMRLFETTEDDVRYDHDMLVPLTRDGSNGVRVVIV